MFKELNIIKPLLDDPQREFNVRELAKIIKHSPATTSKYLKYFHKKTILTYKNQRILDLYKANLESTSYRDLKVYYNITKVRKLIPKLNKFYLKPTIVLFGSKSTGLDTKDSDTDLLILSEKKKIMKTRENIQLFIYKNISDISNKDLLSNMRDGIILQGDLY